MTPERRLLRKVYRDGDRGMQRQLADAGMRVSCSRGCSHCCYQEILVTEPEAVAMLDHYQHRGFDRDELRPALERSAAAPTATPADYFDRQIPCAFLRDGECSVYAARPIACRTHFSVSPASQCAAGPLRPVMNPDFRRNGLRMAVAAATIAADLGYEQVAIGRLARVVLKVLG